MARTWLTNSRAIARKVKKATEFSNHRINDCGAEVFRECPNCKHLIDNRDVSLEWPGLPAGVKFDPTDVELLDHLAGKVGIGNSKLHVYIDEFISTLEDNQGICYTHPENLPGVKKDGSSVHFFHKTSNAYATGQRKRRKIYSECNNISDERVRWHKTGKTKRVMENGVQKGWKKIMVLYSSSKKACKADKTNWVMHQYHLGTEEEEKDGELVVSKIFVKQMDKSDAEQVKEETDLLTIKAGPTTPNTTTPKPPRPEKDSLIYEDCEDSLQALMTQKGSSHEDVEITLSIAYKKDDGVNPLWLSGESEAVEELDPRIMDKSLLCNELLDNIAPADESAINFSYSDIDHGRNEIPESNTHTHTISGFSDLDNLVMDTPPDFQLADLQFGSQDSITSWLDRL